MVHKVIVRKRAIIQFQSICDYLAEEFGEHTADDFEFEVENCVATLRKFPAPPPTPPLHGRGVPSGQRNWKSHLTPKFPGLSPKFPSLS